MKRLTRKIGVLGPGAVMSAMGAKKSVPAGSAPKADPGQAGAGADPEKPPARRGWFLRLLLGDDDGK